MHQLLDELRFRATKTSFVKLVEFPNALARLLGSIDVTGQECEKALLNRRRNLHSAPEHQAGDIAGAIGDAILHQQQLEQVTPRHRHQEIVRQVRANLVLQLVRLVLQRDDAFSTRNSAIPVVLDRAIEKLD